MTRNALLGNHGCIFCLCSTHIHTDIEKQPFFFFFSILLYKFCVLEQRWYIIFFLLSFSYQTSYQLCKIRSTANIYWEDINLLQEWPKLLLIVVAGLNSCPRSVYNCSNKQFVLKIMTNRLYLVYKRTVCSLNTCTRIWFVIEKQNVFLSNPRPAAAQLQPALGSRSRSQAGNRDLEQALGMSGMSIHGFLSSLEIFSQISQDF